MISRQKKLCFVSAKSYIFYAGCVISSTSVGDYMPITRLTDEAEPRSNLIGTWYVRAPYVIEPQSYRPVRAVDVDLIKSRTRIVRGGYGKPVVRDALVAKGKRLRPYAPGEIAGELVAGLLDLVQNRLRPTDFAERFGYMGYNALVPSDNRCEGEPLDWLLAHAHTLLVVSRLINLLNKARGSDSGRKKLEEYIRQELPYGPYAADGWVFQEPALRGSAGSPIMAANNVIRFLLNPHLDGVGRQLVPEKADLRSVFTFRAPICVAYWHVAQLYGKETLRRCKECGRVFMHDRDVEFCLPEPPKTISPCKSRFNVRRWRRKPSKKRRKR